MTRVAAVRERVAEWRRAGLRVGFVPTMGNLHEGHVSLVGRAQQRADRVVVSVFVNPLQFGPGEDFEQYPRTPERDAELLQRADASLLFAPAASELYPGGSGRSTVVDVPELSGILEGQFRPGHFQGVATVVAKLLQVVQPDVAVFGEKDFQQLVIVKRLVADLCMPVEIAGAPTIRDHDGLAFSSRNRYLTPAERAIAPRLHAALQAGRRRLEDGERDYAAIEAAGLQELQHAGFAPDYFSVRQAADLLPPRADSRELVILTAARLGLPRLLDNIRVPLPASS